MNELVEEFPGRSRQIETLINWFGEPTEKTPHSIFIHGNRALGKTEIIKKLFEIGFPKHNYSFLNCKIYFQLDDLFEVSLNLLSGKKHKCKNFDEFATTLQDICETSDETRYLIFDNAELLWNFSQTLVSALLTLPQWTGANLCIIFITQVPWEKFRRYVGMIEPFQLYFPEYSRSDVIQILEKTCPKDEDVEFYSSFVTYIYDVFSDSCDLIDLFRVIPDLYIKFIQPQNEERVSRNDYSLLFNELNPHVELALDNLYSQNITSLIENQLPTWSLYLLIAAFLASYIPQSLDKHLFSKEHEKQKHSRKRRKKEFNALKFNEQFTGPQTSEMERIIAIFQSIYQDSIIPYILLLQQLETFVSYHLFTRTTPVERKDVQSFRCNLSFNYIKQISKSINFDILRYLDDSSTM
ncbi:origin recognition complex subunit 5 C-terminus-domain-containing protein [Glomus cerebriforme]|uniref:Origin recognition complex subunit 5 C-terminus-domain-containing protein n=1 Tax=Glomus cerebriforme TaxID=658196 RepID=A0A397SPU5_9GLOM|nr:origin recognition complex subunit 5 C-terminus-domain-containing protein [Glomus cerebriforme]